MDVHQNAKNTPSGRRLMVQRLAAGWTIKATAAAFGVTAKTVRKWQARHALQGEPAWSTARRGRAAARPAWMTPPWPRFSRRCAASAWPDPPSPASSAGPPRP